MQLLQFLKHNKFLFLHCFIYIVGFYGIYRLFGDISLWFLVGAFVWSKLIQLIGHSIGFHRYFSHSAFETTKFGHWLICLTSILIGVGSPISYARNHRFHHRVADEKRDLHSPVTDGKIKTFLGLWTFHDLNWFLKKGTVQVRDLIKDPLIRWIHKWYYEIWTVLIISTCLIDWKLMVYGLVLPSLIFHIELNIFVNFFGHSYGYRNFETPDWSRNNMWIQWYNLGEGLHNNHHEHAGLYDFAIYDGEFDPSAWVIDKFLSVKGSKKTKAGRLKIHEPAKFNNKTILHDQKNAYPKWLFSRYQ